jgi:hypothetical protein
MLAGGRHGLILSKVNTSHKSNQGVLGSLSWRQLILIATVVLFGLLLRLHALEDIHLWQDETDWFDEQVYGDMSVSLRRYAALKAQEHTVGPAWPIIVAGASRVFGGKAMVARLPSVFFGTTAIVALFFLVFRIFQSTTGNSAFIPAVFVASLTAISILQLEFSQRLHPFGAIPLLATVIIVLHLEIVQIIQNDTLSIERLSILAFLYALVGGFSLFLHLSFTILLWSSFLIFLILGRSFLHPNHKKQVTSLGIASLTMLAIFFAWIGNVIHLSQSGYRPYLTPYYHSLDFGAIIFLITKTYDLLTYQLNLFYNSSLYWPRQLNPVLLPLVALCVIGWLYAAAGKCGQIAKQMSSLAAIALASTAILSLFRKYPFGGVRQAVFMTPFLFAFTGMGFYKFVSSRIGKVLGVIMVGSYILLWGINLPHFYRDRSTVFNSQELMTVWEQHEKPKVYAMGGSKNFLRYLLGAHSSIELEDLPYPLSVMEDPPFLFVSTHWPIEKSLQRPKLVEEIKNSGYRANLIMMRVPKYPVNPDCIQSLYFPPNGLWVYKITKDKK